MNEKFKLVSKNKMDKQKLKEHLTEILEEGTGYVLVYKNEKDDRYYCMANGFTQEEGVYGSQLIVKSIVCFGE
ncbi:MAG: hypothetical protein ACTHME_05170 [Candidatus Nitrosocosmicus sp.]